MDKRDMKVEAGLEIAEVYAAALFDLVEPENRLDEVHSELVELVGLADQNADFATFLESDAIDDDDREASLERIFRGRLSDVVLNTLQVMNAHGRLGFVRALLRAFVLRLERARGQVEVTVRSAAALASGEQAQVETLAARLSGRKPVITWRVDPELLGGLVLEIGDRRYDNSVRRHLEQAREQLLARTHRSAGAEVQVSSSE